MLATLRLAADRGVTVGAHSGYADREGFGRRVIPMAPAEIGRMVAAQVGALRGVAACSVIITGPQCLVTTLTMPTGWWIIGRSPTRILTGDPARPFLFDVGDRIRFRRIGRDEFHRAQKAG